VLHEIFGRPVTLVGKEGPKVDVLCCSVSFVYASSFACLLACLATTPYSLMKSMVPLAFLWCQCRGLSTSHFRLC